ncbi:4-hydroxythreonine-4-phosphate dehydrogenase PdxA [Kineococcus sp. SYSU DK003]|uniref:4-hydroxythreonine-4-phosphate dehydrogenase PdxA n=1 Tax=Kineococcus sp. SYSU DK003 TaxID=3383124 RepID=UPI003D7C9942
MSTPTVSTVPPVVDQRPYVAAHRDARPVVIGDAVRLRTAAELSAAQLTPGRIDVVDPHLIPADLPWEQISPAAGHAAHEYVRIACALVTSAAVQAVCTAPLSKAAPHAAGYLHRGTPNCSRTPRERRRCR